MADPFSLALGLAGLGGASLLYAASTPSRVASVPVGAEALVPKSALMPGAAAGTGYFVLSVDGSVADRVTGTVLGYASTTDYRSAGSQTGTYPKTVSPSPVRVTVPVRTVVAVKPAGSFAATNPTSPETGPVVR